MSFSHSIDCPELYTTAFCNALFPKLLMCKALGVLQQMPVRQRCRRSRPDSGGCSCSECHICHVCIHAKHAVTWRRGSQLHARHCPQPGSGEEKRPEQGGEAEEERWHCSLDNTGVSFVISWYQDAYAARFEESMHCTAACVHLSCTLLEIITHPTLAQSLVCCHDDLLTGQLG